MHLKSTKVDEFYDALTNLVQSLDKAAANGLKDVNITELLGVAKKLSDKDESALANAVLDFEEEKKKKGK